MSPGILGKKIGMTQVFNAEGQVVPVTLVKAGPCVVTQRKTPATDGYDAVQLGLVEYAKKPNKPVAEHLKKSGAEGVKFLREFQLGQWAHGDLKPGDRVLAEEFKPKELVDVIGTSKGRGFAGLVKRHHFRGGPATHGSMFHRAAGFDRCVEFSVARVSGHEDGRAHGNRAGDGAEPGNGERGYGR